MKMPEDARGDLSVLRGRLRRAKTAAIKFKAKGKYLFLQISICLVR